MANRLDGTLRRLNLQRRQDCGDLGLQPWQVMLDDAPDLLRIDAEIIVDRNVAKSRDATPVHVRPLQLERVGQPLRRLGKGLEITHHGVLRSARKASLPSAVYCSIRAMHSVI